MILAVGATSFVGPPVVNKLLDENYEIKCLVRTGSNTFKLQKGRTRLTSGNLLSPDSIISCLENVDSVICLIDLKHTDLIKNLLEAISRTTARRVVFLSSTTVLVPLKNHIKDAKLESEEMITSSNLDWTILRASMIYGNEDDRNYSRMIKFINKHGFFIMFGDGSNLIQPVYVEDVANAIALSLNNKKTRRKTYEICGREPVKYKDMLEIIRKEIKKPFRVIRLPIKLSMFAVSVYARFFPNSSLKPDMIERMAIDKSYSYEEASRDFGYAPGSFEHGIKKLICDMSLEKDNNALEP